MNKATRIVVLLVVAVLSFAGAAPVYAYGEECNDGYTFCQNSCYWFGPPAPGCLQACRDEYWSCMNDEDRPYCPNIYYCPRETMTVPSADDGGDA